MADDELDGPRVAPGPLKSSGNKAPWIILAVLVIAVFALVASVIIALIVLRS